MAETTGEKIVRLDTQMAETNRKIDKVGEQVTRLDQKFDTLIEGLDKRYASKLSERIIYALVGMIVVAVIVALLALVVFPNQLGNQPTSPSSSSSSTTTGGSGTPGSAGSTTTNNTSNTTTEPGSSTPQPQGGASVTVPLPQLTK